MNKKQILSFFLSLSLVLTILVVPSAAAFSDVPSSAWYAQDVAAVQKYGILEGTGNGKFSPDGNLTLAQAITMAARTYAYSNHETIPQTGSSTWYSNYLQYAAEKGICSPGEFGTAYDNYCNRLTMAKLFARVIPAGTDQVINDVTSLPDVQAVPENQAVFDLYQLGILTGSDKYGTFHPYQYIKRSETAAILNRVLNTENRKIFQLTPKIILFDFLNVNVGQVANTYGCDFAILDDWWPDGRKAIGLPTILPQSQSLIVYILDPYHHILEPSDLTGAEIIKMVSVDSDPGVDVLPDIPSTLTLQQLRSRLPDGYFISGDDLDITDENRWVDRYICAHKNGSFIVFYWSVSDPYTQPCDFIEIATNYNYL